MTLERDRIARLLREAVLTGGAILGMIAIVVAIGAAAFGLRPLIFRSGSMAPTIDTGALALAQQREAGDLRVGQIVSVMTASDERVTHRIVAVDHGDTGVSVLTLRGDANSVDDAEAYTVSHADVVIFSLPKIGYAVAWLSGPTGRFVLGIYAAFLLMVIFRRPQDRADREGDGGAAREQDPGKMAAGPRGPDSSSTLCTALVLVVGLVGGGVGVAQVTPTLAAWTDTAAYTGTTFTSYTVPRTTLSCARSGNSTVFTWAAVTGATNYTISFSGGTPRSPVTLTGTTFTDTTPSTNRTATVVVNRTFTATWSSVASNGARETSNNGNCTVL